MATRSATFVLIIGMIIAGYEACDYIEMSGQLQTVMKTYNTTPILQYCGKLWDIREKTYSCNASNQSFVEQLNEADAVCGECKLNTLQCSQLPLNCSGYSSCCSLYNESVECFETRGCPPEVLFTRYKHEQDVFCKTKEAEEECHGLPNCLDSRPRNRSQDYCQVLASMLSCVETSCPNQIKNQKPSFSEIDQLMGQFCQELSSYESMFNCEHYMSCIDVIVRQPLDPVSSYSWCSTLSGMSYCANKVAKSDVCHLGSNFGKNAAAAKSHVDKICPNFRIPCNATSVCVKGLQQAASISFSAVCRYVDTFVTCVDKCGDDSKVSSQYTLSDVADNFKAFCQVVEPAITSCSAMASCLVLSNDQSTGADLNKFTDQTYWSKEVKRMVTCVADADCQKSDALVKKLESLKDNIQELQARDINSAVPFALPGVLTMLMVVLVAITIN